MERKDVVSWKEKDVTHRTFATKIVLFEMYIISGENYIQAI